MTNHIYDYWEFDFYGNKLYSIKNRNLDDDFEKTTKYWKYLLKDKIEIFCHKNDIPSSFLNEKVLPDKVIEMDFGKTVNSIKSSREIDW